jgi:two-component system sensor histidine kinase MprB
LQAQADEVGNLIGELVELARDQHELARNDATMTVVVERSVQRAAGRAPDHVFDVDTTPWTTIGDAAALETTLLNLLDNAVKFSPPHSVISIRGGRGWLTVTDQGPGIPQEHRRRAFERFWRAPAARALPGSGLGLAIVADTVAAHEGTARFMTRHEGAERASGSTSCAAERQFAPTGRRLLPGAPGRST